MTQNHTLITVGRQYFSGGRQLADTLGEMLGIKVYDNELVTEAARQSGISPELFRSSDEKRRLWGLGAVLGSDRYGILNSGINDGELFRLQSEAIRKIASEGDAIFVGRASDYVLRDMETLNIFVHAPLEFRCRRYAQANGVTLEEAESVINKTDKARAEFYNFFTFGHWGKCASYHLSVDSSVLGIEGTARLVIGFGRACGRIR